LPAAQLGPFISLKPDLQTGIQIPGRAKAAFVAKMGDCLKELDETQYWLELLTEGGIVAREKLAGLANEAKDLTAIFVTIIKSTKKNNS
jgi:four helix bundle protein